jgi:2-iminobutanoate/2-iminopropanoate deaminase
MNTTTILPKQVFGPYTPVRKAGDLYFISGQVGVDPDTKTAAPDVAEQTRQAIRNLQVLLEENRLCLKHVIKTTIFLTDMGDFAAVNEVYAAMFDEPWPARSAIAVKELPRVGGDVPIVIEIEAIACARSPHTGRW